MITYTIVRNGTIEQTPFGTHKCGLPEVSSYPYRVELTVSGHLQGPDYFIVDNQEIDDIVQACFHGKASVSCELMCDVICQAVLAYLPRYVQWQAQHLHVELTGTNGRAMLSCDWTSPTLKMN